MFEEDDKNKRHQWQIFHLEEAAEKVNRMHKNLLSGKNNFQDYLRLISELNKHLNDFLLLSHEENLARHQCEVRPSLTRSVHRLMYLDDPLRGQCLICGSEDVEIKEFPRSEEIYKEVVENGEPIKQLVSVISEIIITYKCKNCGNVVTL